MTEKSAPSQAVVILSIVCLALLAPLLGGSSERWSEAIVLIGFGLLLAAHPPRMSLGLPLNIVLVLLLGWGLLAFTPASWWKEPWWRLSLQNDFHVELPSTLTPQPWLTLESWWLLLAGCLWFYFLATLELDGKQRRVALRGYVFGIILLTCCSLLFHFVGLKISFWNSPQNLGPFSNRNQMGNLLALAGLGSLACAFHDGENKKRWLFAWFLGLGVILAALIINYSRAGLLLFFVGAFLWALWIVIYTHSPVRMALALCTLLLLLASLFLFGGKSLQRLQLLRTNNNAGGEAIRWLVQADALRMSKQFPLTGVGLGNFEATFPWYRNQSISQSRAIHPESDWLWLATEMGWPSVLLVLTAVGLLLPRWQHIQQHSDRATRAMCLICGLLFLLHGLVDVSGHRIGTLWPALFLFSFSLGLPPGFPSAPAPTALFFRGCGLLLVMSGAWWLLQTAGLVNGPGAASVARLKRNSGLQQGLFPSVVAQTTRALASAPLDWTLYYQRAQAELHQPRGYSPALEDFRRARFLEPCAASLPLDEGMAWLGRRDDLALAAWSEALNRAPTDKLSDIYNQMFTHATTPFLLEGVEELASKNDELKLLYWQRAPQEKVIRGIRELLQSDPELTGLSENQKQTLFKIWIQSGDISDLRPSMEAHPNWRQYAWPGLADEAAKRGDYQEAWMMIKSYAPVPILPVLRMKSSLPDLEKAFVVDPNNPIKGFALYTAQQHSGHREEALQTLLKLSTRADCPKYIYYLEAQLWAEKGAWQQAWQTWKLYQPNS